MCAYQPVHKTNEHVAAYEWCLEEAGVARTEHIAYNVITETTTCYTYRVVREDLNLVYVHGCNTALLLCTLNFDVSLLECFSCPVSTVLFRSILYILKRIVRNNLTQEKKTPQII